MNYQARLVGPTLDLTRYADILKNGEFLNKYRDAYVTDEFVHRFEMEPFNPNEIMLALRKAKKKVTVKAIRQQTPAEDAFKWCEDQIVGEWDLLFRSPSNHQASFHFCFVSERDALLFKMFWT